MKREREYVQVRDGERVRPVMKGYRMQCCDCGLVHSFTFTVRHTKGGRPYVVFKAVRDKRATAAVRRHKKAKRK